MSDSAFKSNLIRMHDRVQQIREDVTERVIVGMDFDEICLTIQELIKIVDKMGTTEKEK